jgi:hypothetical protein
MGLPFSLQTNGKRCARVDGASGNDLEPAGTGGDQRCKRHGRAATRGAHSIAEAIGRARQPVRRRFFGLG